MWVDPRSDEVGVFHPAFEEAANEALGVSGLAHQLRWVHHHRTPTSRLIPDFVLTRRDTNRWLLALEIKRGTDAVYSARYQVQAKGYAEANAPLYDAGPVFFAISNLENTLLFALDGASPPWECLLRDGNYHSGILRSTDAELHKAAFTRDLAAIIARVAQRGDAVVYDRAWPTVVSRFLASVATLAPAALPAIAEPTSPNWSAIRRYFGVSLEEHERYVYLLQCLLTEYLRGVLQRFAHPAASRIPAISSFQPESVARAISILQTIDFAGVFEGGPRRFYHAAIEPARLNDLRAFVDYITTAPRRVFDLARSRLDASEFIESLYTASFPLGNQDDFGKVQTDPQLAALLAAVSVPTANAVVLDPCCGEGALLSAAYDVLVSEGARFPAILGQLRGIEADGIAVRLCLLKLALKEPGAAAAAPVINIQYGDLFANAAQFRGVDVVLMNPPFKRYEAQDPRPVPQELRQYYEDAIEQLDGHPAATTRGQSNLFHYYVEFAAKAMADGAYLGVILDNRWYHNKYGVELRRFILSNFEVVALLEYPHQGLFEGWTIATSVAVLRKTTQPRHDHRVKFIRAKVDPRQLDLEALRRTVAGQEALLAECSVRQVLQSELHAQGGWKTSFQESLAPDYVDDRWPSLVDLFHNVRRGSLQKEGGGLDVLDFPFSRDTYGFVRTPGNGSPFHTGRGRPLTEAENQRLGRLANAIPTDFRGYALKNSDGIGGYLLAEGDVTQDQTLEPPILRQNAGLFASGQRARWREEFEEALAEIQRQAQTRNYVQTLSQVSNLDEGLLPRSELWVCLREPHAGELIVPRKVRNGHRVHINPFAFHVDGRQVRISSNFISFGGYVGDGNLEAVDAVHLLAAFLLSSFGQLQFEMKGYNREGVLSIEKHHLQEVRVFHPTWVRAQARPTIIEAFRELPYPIDSRTLAVEQHARNELDRLFAGEICFRNPALSAQELVDRVHQELDEWLLARQP